MSTPHRAARAEAQEAALFRRIFEASIDAMLVFELTPEGRPTPFADVNAAACERLGYRRDEFLRMTVADIVDPASTGCLEHLAQIRDRGCQEFESVLVTRDGRQLSVAANAYYVPFDSRGTVVTVCRDVTRRKEAERTLRQQQEHLVSALLHSPVILFNQDSALRYTWVYNQHPSFDVDEILGRTDAELFLPENAAPLTEIKRHVLETGCRARKEVTTDLDGERLSYDLYVAPATDAEGRVVGVTGASIDITPRKRMEQVLAQREAESRAILDTTVDAIITIDEQGRIGTFNQAAERIFGYRAGEVVGGNVAMLMPSPYAGQHDQYLRRYLETGERRIIGIGRKVAGRRKDGSTFPMELSVSEVETRGGRRFTGIVRDLTERQRLEHEVLQISEQERQRFGQDLHDGLASLLAGLAMLAAGLAYQARGGQPVAPAQLDDIARAASEGAEQARTLARGLNPVWLEEQGLEAALRDLANRTCLAPGQYCTFSCPSAVPDIDGNARNHLYWVAHEAVSNAVRHAQAQHIEIHLSYRRGRLMLTVTDDGVGLPPARDVQTGMGLRNMRYRADLIGAELEVDRASARGTRVRCVLTPV